MVETAPGLIDALTDGREPEMKLQFVAGGCWIFPGATVEQCRDAANACNRNGDCGEPGVFDIYP